MRVMGTSFRVTQVIVILAVISSLSVSNADDTINATQSLTDHQTLVSSRRVFELGFFSPGNSKNWYLGIWFNIPDKTVVWVANRETPLKNSSSGTLRIIPTGNLILVDDTNATIWSSNNSLKTPRNPILRLLDSGNLVLRDANDDGLLWQSFDHPTDAMLPGMALGLKSVYLTAWKTDEDPSPGAFSLFLNPTGYAQVFITKNGVDQARVGPWNGLFFSGTPYVNVPSIVFSVHKTKEGLFFLREDSLDGSMTITSRLNPNGVSQRWKWVDQTKAWVRQVTFPVDNCDTYNYCGAYGKCTVGNYPLCVCLDKFVPEDPKGWAEGDWSTNGCIRRTPLDCRAGDGFIKYPKVKPPDARNSWYNESMTLEECRVHCLKNCSCMAYTTLNISGRGSGCLVWFGDLIDIRALPENGQDLYIRMASSDLGSMGKTNAKLIASLTAVGVVLLALSMLLCIWKTRKDRIAAGRRVPTQSRDLELPLFHLSTISKATRSFAFQNKIGEGGFGPVYKGTLEDGQHIAVKRLSETSKQGLNEFKNEVIFVAKLQHRNLVKLLGCCIEGEEKMLIYEYMPNKSLDTVLFDQRNSMSLDWPKRYQIVNGIARGLVYLHQDSRLRIIHRDLKASNILLDGEMNPKISDFGIAKRYREDVVEDKTTRVVGTYGYMSPEYAICGRFSEKSDVFSFGVIVLEIVRGKRNSSHSYGDCALNLLGYAWTLQMEGRSIDFIDSNLCKSDNLEEMLRLIHLGLLCVQQHPDERPSMTSVVGMLSNDSELPQPNRPGFFMESYLSSSASTNPVSSTNEVTWTTMSGR